MVKLIPLVCRLNLWHKWEAWKVSGWSDAHQRKYCVKCGKGVERRIL